MNGLTTIAALPNAAGCKAELSAETATANAPSYACGGYVMGFDISHTPSQTSKATATVRESEYFFEIDHVVSFDIVKQVEEAFKESARRNISIGYRTVAAHPERER